MWQNDGLCVLWQTLDVLAHMLLSYSAVMITKTHLKLLIFTGICIECCQIILNAGQLLDMLIP